MYIYICDHIYVILLVVLSVSVVLGFSPIFAGKIAGRIAMLLSEAGVILHCIAKMEFS